MAKRISEIVQSENISLTDSLKNNTNFPILKLKSIEDRFYKLEFENFILAADKYNKWFLTKNNQVVIMKHVIMKEGTPYIVGSSVKYLTNIFETPIRSSFLNIFKSKSSESDNNFKLYLVSSIKAKLVTVEYENEMFFFPLLHTVQ